ncbi:hypothetical protein DFJ74DRAFT_774316 [Hyaloraphidium curvatum]|nr:hypothetical protein DFJ74DRAFT_774316 [Hyaloraphidium curvatum]
MAPNVDDSLFLLLERLQPRARSLFPFKDPVLSRLLSLHEQQQLRIISYDWDLIDSLDPNNGTYYGGQWFLRDRNWAFTFFTPGPSVGADVPLFVCGALRFGPGGMGPHGHAHGGISAAALDSICGMVVNVVVSNSHPLDDDWRKWKRGNCRTFLFNLTYRRGVKLETTYGFNIVILKKEGRKVFLRGGIFEVEDVDGVDQWYDTDPEDKASGNPKGKRARKYAVELDALFIDAPVLASHSDQKTAARL